MATATANGKSTSPPYVSFKTVLTVLDKLKEDTIPQRIDRSYWGSFLAGGTGQQVMAALRFLGLIDENDQPTPQLTELVNQEGKRPELIAELVRQRYAPALKDLDLDRATMGLVDGAFKDAYQMEGETLRKAETFFIHAAQFGKLPLSPHIAKRLRKGRPPKIGKGNIRPKVKTSVATPSTVPPQAGALGTNAKTISLRSGGSVTVTIAFDLFTVNEADRRFCFDLIDTLRKYEQEHPAVADPVGDSEKEG
jgi:hypothetical protein